MATATSRKAAPPLKALKHRRALCEEILALERKMRPDETRQEEISTELKQLAADAGGSFKEPFGADYVSATGPVAAEFKGDVPVVQTEVWNALKPAEKKDLVKRGIVKIEPQWGRPSSGRVTVKVH